MLNLFDDHNPPDTLYVKATLKTKFERIKKGKRKTALFYTKSMSSPHPKEGKAYEDMIQLFSKNLEIAKSCAMQTKKEPQRSVDRTVTKDLKLNSFHLYNFTRKHFCLKQNMIKY